MPVIDSLVSHFEPRNARHDSLGKPIMFDTPLRRDGTAGDVDPTIRWRMLNRNQCGVCGDDLGSEAAFIGTPEQARTGRFCTPALHVDCARYAFEAFEFFADPCHTGKVFAGYQRSPELILYVCESYRVLRCSWLRVRGAVRALHASAIVQAAPATRIERHTGRDSMLLHLDERGGCPPHSEMTATGCAAHADLLTLAERRRRGVSAGAANGHASGKIANLRDAFKPRNLRVEPTGFPLTYDVSLLADGSPKGIGADMFIERHMLRARRCGVCGDELGSEVAFVGTTVAAAKRWFSTPGLHVDCARYSFATCPVLSKPTWKARDGKGSLRTPEMVLVIADSFRYSRIRWWVGKLCYRRQRLDFGFAKASKPWHVEQHTGRKAMLEYLNEQGGCPAHREQAITGAPAHTPGVCPVTGARSVSSP